MARAAGGLVLLVAVVSACGGGRGDEDAIKALVADVAGDRAVICDRASARFLARLGGDVERCRREARRTPDDPDETIAADAIAVELDGDTATAVFTDNEDRRRRVTFVRGDGGWLVDAVR